MRQSGEMDRTFFQAPFCFGGCFQEHSKGLRGKERPKRMHKIYYNIFQHIQTSNNFLFPHKIPILSGRDTIPKLSPKGKRAELFRRPSKEIRLASGVLYGKSA